MTRSDELCASLSRVALGDRAAFARVYELTSAHLFGVAQRMLGDRQWAEDVLQESFVNVWKNATSYNAALSQPMTWLIAIVRNRCLDALRSQGRRIATTSATVDVDREGSQLEDDFVDAVRGPVELLDEAIDALRVRACMDALDARIRQSLALAYYQGMSNTEVAAHLSSPLGSVKTWIRRGLQQLKRCLEAATHSSSQRGDTP
jgi:RNA polymerase sigma-70 factor, ECF subfamily